MTTNTTPPLSDKWLNRARLNALEAAKRATKNQLPPLNLPVLRPDQQAIVNHPAKIKIICCGRRFGKTVICEVVAIPSAVAGEHVAWVVPTYKNSRVIWRLLETLLRPLAKYGVRMRISENTVDFPSGGTLSVFSAHTQDSADAIRSNAFHKVIMDEGARIDELTFTDVILPTLADYDGSLLIPSTPNGKNWFFREYMRGLSDMQYQASFHAPTSANPLPNIQKAFELARERLPERSFREEWLAEFVEDGAVFRKLTEAQTKYKAETPPYSRRCVFGVDWAQMHDFTVITVIDSVTKRVLEIDRFNQVAWAFQRERLKALYAKWQPSAILAELNSIGSPNVEALQAEGLPVIGFTTTNETKTEVIQALSLGFEKEEIALPDNPTLIGELMSYAAERLPSGKWRFNAPAGMHDDCVISLALAFWQSLGHGVPDELSYTYRDQIPDDWRRG